MHVASSSSGYSVLNSKLPLLAGHALVYLIQLIYIPLSNVQMCRCMCTDRLQGINKLSAHKTSAAGLKDFSV